MGLEKIDCGLLRLKIPFEDLTTTVYFYICDEGVAIIDSATYVSDVDDYIVPALERLNVSHADVKFLLLTHSHGDHSGGLERLSEIFPNAIIMTSFELGDLKKENLTDNKKIIGDLKAIHLPGHTDHSFGFYDESTKTLLSGDCLQLDGVGKYRNGVLNREEYFNSISKLKIMGIKRIVAAHEYDPLGSLAEGDSAVEKYLNKCVEIAKNRNYIIIP